MVGESERADRCSDGRPQACLDRERAHAPYQSRHRVRNECSSGTRISRTSATGLSGRSAFRSARTCGPDSPRFRDRRQTLRRPTQDTDSHGVSDPSGHARGHFQRGHRGRSRHVSRSDRGTGACAVGGKERRPSCWCRALTVKLAARESVIGGAGGGPSLASLMPGGSARTGSGGQPRFPRSSPRSSSAVDIRRRQPGGRDAGTVARARRTQPVQVRGRWRRPR